MMKAKEENQILLKEIADQPNGYTTEKNSLVKEKEDETKKPAPLFQLFREATLLDYLLMFVGTLAAIIHGTGWPVMFIFFGGMTDAFVQVPANISTNITAVDEFTDTISRYAVYFVCVGAAVFVSASIQVACWTLTCERQAHRMRLHFFSAILRQEIGWFDVHQSGELTARLADDIERVKDGIGDKFSYAIQYFSQFVSGFVIGFTCNWNLVLRDDIDRVREGIGDKFSYAIQYFSQFVSGFVIGFTCGWKMALVMLSLTPLLAVAGGFMAKMMATFSEQEQTAYARAGSVAEEVLSSIRTVTSLNGQAREVNRYKDKLEEGKTIGIKKSWISGIGTGFTFLTIFAAYALGFWYGTEQVKEWYRSEFAEGISPGTVPTVFFSIMVGTYSIGNVTPHLSSLAAAKGVAASLYEVIDNITSIDSSSYEGLVASDIDGRISFRNVNFTYPSRPDVKILKNFNMEVKPGQTVALVGSSGCGKSTTTNLIQRFYDPNSGSICVDGKDIKEYNVQSLRECIGVVSQEPILFGMSIEDNILLGDPTASMDHVIDAARSANCHDFITKLPEGYKTIVGERGAQLSGGQKQRVAIARALIRNPKILLLDEATSALDTQSERIVQEALDKARQGRTTIVIAHRLSTIQNADMIYVVKDGVIVEMGKHGDLMAQQGEYYQLVTVQMLVENGEEHVDSENNKNKHVHFSDGKLDNAAFQNLRVFIEKLRQTISATFRTTEINDFTSAPRKQKLSKSKIKPPLSHQIPVSKPQVSRKHAKKKDMNEDEEKETTENAKFIPMLRENKPEWPYIVGGSFAAAINGCMMPAFAMFYGEMIKQAFIVAGSFAAAISGCMMPAFAMFYGEMIKVFQDRGENSLLWSMMFLVLGGIQFFTNIVQSVSFGHSGEKMTMRLRLKTFTAMLRQDIAYFDDPRRSTGALTMRLATDATMVKTATGIRIATFVQAIFGMVAALVIAFIYGWQLALVVLAGVPLMAASGLLQYRAMMGGQKKDSVEMEQAGKTASESIENIRTVQSLTRESHFYHLYQKYLSKPYKTKIKLVFPSGLTYGLSQGIVFMIYAGAFRYGGYMVTEELMEPSDVFKVFFAISLTGLVVGQAFSFLPDYSKAAFSAGIIFKVLGTIPPIDVYSKTGTYPSKLSGAVEFKNVFFNYPARLGVPILKGVNIKVKAGQTVALVGPSGCGKSTLISLIQRFYDPSHGSVEIDGLDIRDLNLQRLRQLISLVSQEPVLFGCSIKDNITYGMDDQVEMTEVIRVARLANVHNFISELPKGYDTVVGEKGTQLSGGQKQRVAIARALIRNPRILLLDEATSALDTESEKLVKAALDNAQEGRTCIVIAHRLSTIQNADVIYVIDSGNVVEYGNHQQLLNKNGVYAQLVSAQKLAKT